MFVSASPSFATSTQKKAKKNEKAFLNLQTPKGPAALRLEQFHGIVLIVVGWADLLHLTITLCHIFQGCTFS